MGRNFLILFGVLGLCGLAGLWDGGGAPPPVSETSENIPIAALSLPPFRFTPLGETVARDSASLRGRAVLINFWASWCVPCVAEFPALLKLVARYPGRLTLLAVSVDHDSGARQRFLDRMQAEHPDLFPTPSVLVVPDPQRKLAQDLFQTVRYPETILVDADGRMRGKIVGADADWLGPDLQTQIEGLLPP